MKPKKICIIIPAYNEEKRIQGVLEGYSRFFKTLKKKGRIDFEILVVINNTTDKTQDIVKNYQKTCKQLKYLNFKMGGKGFAIRKGFEYALAKKFDLIGFTDADNSTDSRNFYKILDEIGESDGAIGSRYLKNSIVRPKQSFIRILASRVFNFMVRGLFLIPFRDTQNGCKIFKKKVVGNVINKLSISQWAVDIDLLYHSNKEGFRIKEIPISWKDSEGSHIDIIRSSIQMALAILQLRFVNSPFKRFKKVLKPSINLIYKLVK